MTRNSTTVIDLAALINGGTQPMKLDIFKGARWRGMVSEKDDEGRITVELSSGRKVVVDSKFLGFLRVLAEELAKNEPTSH